MVDSKYSLKLKNNHKPENKCIDEMPELTDGPFIGFMLFSPEVLPLCLEADFILTDDVIRKHHIYN